MQTLRILYLDNEKDKYLFKALNKHGDAFYVRGINQALFLMAEHDFDYFFVDADTPQSNAFIKHLRHDPDLVPPQGLILLTNNDDEDCEAWEVDTFLIRESAVSDLPYIFSHIKADRREPAPVLRIAPAPQYEESPVTGKTDGAGVGVSERSGEDESLDTTETMDPDRRADAGFGPAGKMDPDRRADVSFHKSAANNAAHSLDEASFTQDAGGSDDIREHLRSRHTASRQPRKTAAGPLRDGGRAIQPATTRKLAVAVLLLVGLLVWAFAWGPLDSKKEKETARKSVGAESSKKKTGKSTATVPSAKPSSTPAQPATGTPAATQTATPAPGDQTAGNDRETTVNAPQTPPPAPPPAVNHAPLASISGPAQVMRGQPATYSASGSDPDGDACSMSWTTRTMCWSAPGTYSLSVSVVDSKGASGGDTISVRVI